MLYFLVFAGFLLDVALGAALVVLGAALASLTGFIGWLQHTSWHVGQPQGSSTKTTSPQFSHWYFSPFCFAKNSPSKSRYMN